MGDHELEVVEPIPRPYEGEKPAIAWPEEVKQEAVDLAIELKSCRKAARQLGIPARTVQFWLAETVVGAADDWNMLQIRELESKIEQVLARIGPEQIDKAGLCDLVIAAGVLLDKRQQMLPKARGESPQRLRIAWKDGAGAVEIETGN